MKTLMYYTFLVLCCALASAQVTVDPPSNLDNATADAGNGTEVDAVCEFPADLVGDWWSTIWGKVSVTDDQEILVKLQDGGEMALSCHSVGPSNYLIVADTNNLEGGLYTCLKFERRNSNNFHVKIRTARGEDGRPAVSLTADEVIQSPEKVCNVHNNVLSGDLLKKGQESVGALRCPQSLRGNFNVTFTDGSEALCPNGADMTSCDKPKYLVFDYSPCQDNSTQNAVELTGTEEYLCVAGGSNQVTVFKNEQDKSSPFQCLAVSEELDVVMRSNGCGDQWKKTSENDVAVTFSLDKTSDCEALPDPGRKEGKNSVAALGPLSLVTSILLSLVMLVISSRFC